MQPAVGAPARGDKLQSRLRKVSVWHHLIVKVFGFVVLG